MRWAVWLALLAGPGCVGAPDELGWAAFDVAPESAHIVELTFEADQELLDDETSQPIEAPQWRQDETDQTRASPVSYASYDRMRVSAVFDVDPSAWSAVLAAAQRGQLYVRAQTQSGINIPKTPARTADPYQIRLEHAEANRGFREGEVRAPDLFEDEIRWQIGLGPCNTWMEAGRTQNRIYVTRFRLSPPGPELEHLVAAGPVDAPGQSADLDIIDGVWNGKPGEKRYASGQYQSASKTPRPYSYYRSWANVAYTWVDFQTKRDGQCGVWRTKLILDLCRALGEGVARQGIHRATITPKNREEWMLVKNWTFTNDGGAIYDQNGYKWVNVPARWRPAQPYGPMLPPYVRGRNEYNWKTPLEVTDAAGVAGQNSPNPVSTFPNHAVVEIDLGAYGGTGTKIYDPSYGKIYDDLAAFHRDAIEGFYTIRQVAAQTYTGPAYVIRKKAAQAAGDLALNVGMDNSTICRDRVP